MASPIWCVGAGVFLLVTHQAALTEPEPADAALARVRTICVETFSGDATLTATARDIAIASLFGAKRFVVTERCDKADAILKGAILERSGTKVRAEGEGAGFGVAAGGASTTAAAIGAAAGGSEEALYSKETQQQASVSVRLVDADGVVIWAHTQESPGGKVKGAVVDAVERALRQLVKDVGKAGEKARGKEKKKKDER